MVAVHMEGHVEVIIGTTVIPLQPDVSSIRNIKKLWVTDAPVLLPPVLTLDTKTDTPNAQTQYIIAHRTLVPGRSLVNISGTRLSLTPFATALIINGETSSLTPILGEIYTTVAPLDLNPNNHFYTANCAGYIVLGPSTILIPGGCAAMKMAPL
ncbi:hypothetical protein NX059_008539 [Plenodomus lindquistii]|nr:hypothetical protein NX059_008539 [Plenodomus lindquistii]